ncbi:hypothetical protein [Bacilliculturomica massiliensis]|uniref:hypothetical protein n=1 Tax=Bacilliculturomica massiliensis TaxID=1917867 RepID=UPI0013EF11A3|nr:hypothetical protein [Bacilliculturomica massiliensis]
MLGIITYGGPQKDSVEKMIRESEESVREEEQWLENAKKKIEAGYAKISMEERQIINA